MGIFSQLEVNFDREIVEDFVFHYALMCKNMKPLIAGLLHPENYRKNMGELAHIFHNIKSAAGFLQLEPLMYLSYVCEEVVEQARMSQTYASKALVDWLVVASEQFECYRRDIGKDAADFTGLNPSIIQREFDSLERV